MLQLLDQQNKPEEFRSKLNQAEKLIIMIFSKAESMGKKGKDYLGHAPKTQAGQSSFNHNMKNCGKES